MPSNKKGAHRAISTIIKKKGTQHAIITVILIVLVLKQQISVFVETSSELGPPKQNLRGDVAVKEVQSSTQGQTKTENQVVPTAKNDSNETAAVATSSPVPSDKRSWRSEEYTKRHAKTDTGLKVHEHVFGYPTNVDKNEVSIVTQCTIDKFQRLLDLDSRWNGGYMSVAVYLESPSKETLKNIAKWKHMHFGHEDGQSKVSFHLVINNDAYHGEYPTNFLRSVAMDYAITDYALILDADLIPSPNTRQNILQHLPNFDLSSQKQALIVPAFERKVGPNEVVTAKDLPLSKAALMAAMNKTGNSMYIPFCSGYYKKSHAPTDFDRWYKLNKSYQVQYGDGFEPYVIVYRPTNRLPRFWERLVGFGYDKQSFLEEMSLAGYTFHVLPSSFLIHINHDYPYNRVMKPNMIEEYIRIQQYFYEEYGKAINVQQLHDHVKNMNKNYFNKQEKRAMERLDHRLALTKKELAMG